MRALVIEDDQNINKLVERVLRRERFSVDTAKDGEAGIALLEERTYDVVIMDIQMPKRSGYDVAAYLRAKKPGTLDNTIVMTAVTEKGRDSERLRGVRYIISKPFDIGELMQYAQECASRSMTEGYA